jgi:hypothetical protein
VRRHTGEVGERCRLSSCAWPQPWPLRHTRPSQGSATTGVGGGSPQRATLAWPRPEDQAVFRAQAAVASVAKATATVHVAADTRTVLRTTTQPGRRPSPYSAGRMLDLVEGVISVCDSRLWGRRLLGR